MSRAFTDVMRDFNGGAFAAECTDKMAELVKAIKDVGKGGSITVKIKLKPGKTGNLMTIEPTCTLDAPQRDNPVDYMFADDNNSLVVDNPKQKKLVFTEVIDNDTGEIREIQQS